MRSSKEDLAMYLEIRRDCSGKSRCQNAAAQTVQSATYASKNPMMERWQQETMREQPYNNVAAVKVTEHGATDGGTTNHHHAASRPSQLNATSGKIGNKNGWPGRRNIGRLRKNWSSFNLFFSFLWLDVFIEGTSDRRKVILVYYTFRM